MMDTKKLRQKVLDLAIRGKLVPQDPNDEPASALLERVRTEKERLIKEGKIKRDKKEKISDTSYYEKSITNYELGIKNEDVPFEIPESWVWCRLGEICSVVRGGSPRPAGNEEFYNGNIPFLKVADLTNSKSIYVETYQYTIKEAGLSKTRLIKRGTLLLTNSGATLGVPKISKIDATINDGIAAFLDLNKDLIQYLYWFLESQTQNIRKIDQGAAQPNLNTDIIKEFFIPLPPLQEQHRIVQKIEECFIFIDQIEENKLSLSQFIKQTKSKVLDLAIRGKLVPQDPNDEPAGVLLERVKSEQKAKKQTADILHYPFEVPKGWVWCILNDVCSQITDGTHRTPSYTEYGVPFLRVTDITESNASKKFISEDEHKELIKRCHPEKGDVLLSKNGTIGVSKVVDWDYDFSVFVSLCLLKPLRIILDSQYLVFFLSSNEAMKQMKSRGKAFTITNLHLEEIKQLQILIPPFAEQQRIVSKIEQIFSQLDEIENSIKA